MFHINVDHKIKLERFMATEAYLLLKWYHFRYNWVAKIITVNSSYSSFNSEIQNIFVDLASIWIFIKITIILNFIMLTVTPHQTIWIGRWIKNRDFPFIGTDPRIFTAHVSIGKSNAAETRKDFFISWVVYLICDVMARLAHCRLSELSH